ncbi:MAG: flippase [Ignavibacteriales bacterium]|nr:flippase [Ignavibacteriales bacterium]
MKRLSKNVIAITGSDMARRLIGFLTIAYLTRHISVDQFGIINIGFTILTYGLLASSFGLNTYGARAIARGHSTGIVGDILSVRSIASAIVLMIIFICSFIFITDKSTLMVISVMSIAVVPYALMLDWFFQGKERMEVIGAARFIAAVVYFSVVIFFVRSTEHIIWVAIGSLISDTLSVCLIWFIFRKDYAEYPPKFNFENAGSIIKSSFPMGIGSMLAAITMNLPTIIIGLFLSNYDVGIYSAAQKFVFFLLMIDRIIGTIFLPASSRILAETPNILSSVLAQAKKWIVVLSIPICVGGTILSDEIIITVFGGSYAASSNVFRILIWFFFATVLHTIYSSGMLAIGQEKIYSKVMILSAIFYSISIILGTLIFGVPGAAGGMVVAETATLMMMMTLLKKHLNVESNGSLGKILLSVIVMGAVVYILPVLPLIVVILIGAIIYGTMLFLSKAITPVEIRTMISRFV